MNRIIISLLICFSVPSISFSQGKGTDTVIIKAEKEIRQLMKMGDIPGLSIVIIKDGRQLVKNYGYADLEQKKPVTSSTLFEIGSCTKAFTALAVMTLVQQGKLTLTAPVSDYLPWLTVTFEKKEQHITVLQLLHHTSGIPWSTISRIPETDKPDALEQTVRQIQGLELKYLPGKKYEYATINYDVLALIIQEITQQPFETYIQENVIDKLQLNNTTIGYPIDSTRKATGYKTGFFRSHPYNAPVFRGNNAAGYVTTDIEDMAKWLTFQMGLGNPELFNLAAITHRRDETVPLHFMASYAMGWEVSLSGNGEIFHDGRNPNYTSYVAFRPKDKIGVAVLANSNSNYTAAIGNKVIKLLAHEEIEKEYDPGDSNDGAFSMLAFIVGGYILIVIAFLVTVVIDIVKKKRNYEPLSFGNVGKLVLLLAILGPFLYGLYLLPNAIFGFNWKSIIVWTPVSFSIALELVLVAAGISYGAYAITLFFPGTNKFKGLVPRLLLLSILSGLANMVVIVLVTSSLESTVELKYLVFYYLLMLTLYLLGRRFVQVSLVKFTMGAIYELRVQLIDRILLTSYQKFEKIDRGKVYTVMNDDVGTVGESANMMVMLITNFFTACGAFLYLASIAFWASLLTMLLIVTLTTLYYLVSRSTNKYYEEARDTRNVFMRLINGVIDGFKEISLHRNKKKIYKEDVTGSANEYRVKMIIASTRFVNASLIGETVLIAILGTVAFAFPKLFPGIKTYTLISFVVVMLYLIGPVNTILNSVPSIMRLRIAWKRIQQFLKEIPANIDVKKLFPVPVHTTVNSLKAEGVEFQYKNGAGNSFAVGPIDLEVKRGEILFIIGGNGSGKTTLAKLLTGLYIPDHGNIKINNEAMEPYQLGEYFSAVFSPVHLFEKLYNINVKQKNEEVKKYLKLLHLDQKVEIKDNRYSTINLSSGQRKRLALLQCYLEDSPVYLFDEWAADQDPEYRHFFYRTLLPEMKRAGKIIIAITHDDHYFDVADRVLKMNQGQLELYGDNYTMNLIL
jgi:putative pyoverdin transport system ATP-binding/permease protein